MPSKNTFDCTNGEIHISRDGWTKLAMTTYLEDYYDELTSVTWSAVNGYLHNGKYGYLHRYIMQKWYGPDMFSEMSQRGWVVDRMNGEKFDCRISNLEFLSPNHNIAKGHTVDAESERLRMHLALTLCKDFTTGYYQIHLGCNDDISLYNASEGKALRLSTIRFLYNCDYRIVINDAEKILLNYDIARKVDLSILQCVDWKAVLTVPITLREDEKDKPIIERNVQYYVNIGNGIWFHTSHVDEGWVPSEK